MIKKHYYVATTRYARITQITSGQIKISFLKANYFVWKQKKTISFTTSMKLEQNLYKKGDHK